MKNKKKNGIAFDDYIKACRKASREIELERNGGRWIAKDRPHKSKKQYNRRRDRRVTLDDPFNLLRVLFCNCDVVIVTLHYN